MSIPRRLSYCSAGTGVEGDVPSLPKDAASTVVLYVRASSLYEPALKHPEDEAFSLRGNHLVKLQNSNHAVWVKSTD